MERITRADVDRIAATVSESLTERGAERVIETNRRNGYIALDLVRVSDGAQIDVLHVGTAREAYTYLQGMRRTLIILDR